MCSFVALSGVYLMFCIIGSMGASHAGFYTQCRADVVMWPLVVLHAIQGISMLLLGLFPFANPYEPRVIWRLAMLPRALQLLLALFSAVALGKVFSHDAFSCDNHRLYVAEWMYVMANAFFGLGVSSLFILFTPLAGFSLPLPQMTEH